MGSPLELPLVPAFVGSLFLGCISLGWGHMRNYFLPAFILSCGIVHIQVTTAILSPFDLREVMGENPEFIKLTAVLLESPKVKEQVLPSGKSRWKTKVRLRLRRRLADHSGVGHSLKGDVIATMSGRLPDSFFRGRAVQVEGILKRPPSSRAEGLFNYRIFLERQGIYYLFQTENNHDWKIVDQRKDPIKPLSDRFRKWAQETLAKGLNPDDPVLALLYAISLGDRERISSHLKEPFLHSGTMHLFAVSGLHVGLITGMLMVLLRTLRVPGSWCGALLIPALWFYAAVTGWQTSTIRACIMTSVILGACLLKRPPDLINSIAVSALILLIWDPRQLFQSGFQLSFTVVISIALFYQSGRRIWQDLNKTDPYLPDPQKKNRLEVSFSNSTMRYLFLNFWVSLSAWLGSLPLVAVYFHVIAVVGVFVNMLVIPLATFCLMACLGSWISALIVPFLTETFNHSAWFWMVSIMNITKLASDFPGASFFVRAPDPFEIIAYYFVFFGSAGALFYRDIRFVFMIMATSLLLGVICFFTNFKGSELTVLSLSGGDALFYESTEKGGGSNLLIDCGDSSDTEFMVMPFLKTKGLGFINHFLLTHGDKKHVGGAGIIVEKLHPQAIAFADVGYRSTVFRDFIADVRTKSPDSLAPMRKGDRFCDWEILHPTGLEPMTRADDHPLVIGKTIHGVSVLLLSDLSRRGQDVLIRNNPGLKTDILICSVLGNHVPPSPMFLKRIHPKVLIISAGSHSGDQQPNRRFRLEMDRLGIPLFYTHDEGSLTLSFQKDKVSLTTMSGKQWILR